VRRYVIDTNALISFVTDRNLEQQQKIAPLFESAAHMKAVIFCHQHVLTEFIYVLDRIYQVPKDEIGRMIKDLIEMPGIEVIQKWILMQSCLGGPTRSPISVTPLLLRPVSPEADQWW